MHEHHFNTLAAFDNFDHEEATLSGIKGSHDTVPLLFQEKPQRTFSKPIISETNIVHGSKVFKQQLKCQNLQPYIKLVKKPDLPPHYCERRVVYCQHRKKHQRLTVHGC